MPEWINSSPGVLSYGDTGFIVKFVGAASMPWPMETPQGQTQPHHTLESAKLTAEQWYADMKAVGLVQPESSDA